MFTKLRQIICSLRGHDDRWLYAPDLEPCSIECRRCGRIEDKSKEWFLNQAMEICRKAERG